MLDDVRAFLAEPRFAVLATLNRDGAPHQTVVWYELRGDDVVFNTTLSRVKFRNLRRDPRVSLLVGDADTHVRLEGEAHEIATGDAAREDIRRLASRYEGREAGERNFHETYSKPKRVTYAISVRRVYRYGL